MELRRKYSDRYPDVIRLKAEIAAAEAPSAAGESAGSQTGEPGEDDERQRTAEALNGIERELQGLRQEEQLLRQVIQTYEARVENAPKRRDELEQLSREYDTSKDRYDTLLKRYEEAQLAESLEHGKNAEQFRVLDPAIPAAQPSAPNRLWLLTMGLIASLGLAFAAIIVAERLDTTFHSLDDLRSFINVPTVAAIRRIPTQSQARAQRLARRVDRGGRGRGDRHGRDRLALFCFRQRIAGPHDRPRRAMTQPSRPGGVDPSDALVSFTAPASLEADQYRGMRHIVEGMNRDSNLQVFAMTSPSSGEGKTVTTLNLAGSLAQSPEARVLIIDADLHRPSVANYLGMDRYQSPGLIDLIARDGPGLDDATARIDELNLSVLLSGRYEAGACTSC